MGKNQSKVSQSCDEVLEPINGESAPGRTLNECLRHHAENMPDKNGYVFVSTDGSREAITWKELYDTSRKMADFLMSCGVSKNEFVALSMKPCPEWLYVLCGALLAGIPAVSVVFTYKDGSDVMALMDKLKTCSLLFLDPGDENTSWNIVSNLIETVADDGTVHNSKLTGLKRIICRYPPSGKPDVTTIQQVLSVDLGTHALPEVDENDVTYLFQTSGSTGVPKLAVHTHKSAVIYVRYIHPDVFPYDDILFNDRPFMWIGGFPFNIVTGQTRVTTSSVFTSPLQRLTFLIDVIKKERCTSAFLLPPLILYLMKMKDQFGPDWPLRTAITGAMPVTRPFVDCVGTLCKYLLVAYASTEACILSCLVVNDPGSFIDFSCGTQIMVGAMKVVGEKGEVVPVNQRGEIYVKSEALFTAYYNDEDKTREAFEGGWFKTDDLGRMDGNGNITIEGRKSDMIITGGVTVAPAILEAAVKTCTGVENVAIVGIPDDVMFQSICACVIVRSGSGLTESALKSFCEGLHNEKGSLFNTLPRHYLIMDTFPETYTGKVSKRDLTEIAIQRIKSRAT